MVHKRLRQLVDQVSWRFLSRKELLAKIDVFHKLGVKEFRGVNLLLIELCLLLKKVTELGVNMCVVLFHLEGDVSQVLELFKNPIFQVPKPFHYNLL